jgi:hypothetical protein
VEFSEPRGEKAAKDVKRLIVISIALAVSSPALAGHRKSHRRSHRTTVAQANKPAHVEIRNDASDPIGGLGVIPHKKTKKH